MKAAPLSVICLISSLMFGFFYSAIRRTYFGQGGSLKAACSDTGFGITECGILDLRVLPWVHTMILKSSQRNLIELGVKRGFLAAA